MAHILLVDDDDLLRRMLYMALTQSGHKVLEATNGREAVRLIATQPFDLLVTDIIMPDKDGLEVVPEIRKKYPALKIIAMSGGGRMNATGFLKAASMLGADLTLKKPFPVQEFCTAVNELLASG
jgi:DNA-binding response OmpR family regulator